MPLKFKRIDPYLIQVLVLDSEGEIQNEATIGVVTEGTYDIHDPDNEAPEIHGADVTELPPETSDVSM